MALLIGHTIKMDAKLIIQNGTVQPGVIAYKSVSAS